jgi:hypothetical protein
LESGDRDALESGDCGLEMEDDLEPVMTCGEFLNTLKSGFYNALKTDNDLDAALAQDRLDLSELLKSGDELRLNTKMAACIGFKQLVKLGDDIDWHTKPVSEFNSRMRMLNVGRIFMEQVERDLKKNEEDSMAGMDVEKVNENVGCFYMEHMEQLRKDLEKNEEGKVVVSDDEKCEITVVSDETAEYGDV